jgi:hypothetical protein
MQGWCVNKYSFRPDQTHRYTPVDIIFNCTVSSTVTKGSRKKHTVVPSQATVQPADMHGTPKSLFSCDKCNKQYAQPQGVTRHQREVHEINLCPICNDFRWGRRYQLEKHLRERHPGINLDETLCKATRCRREAAMNKKYSRQQQASPPAIECGLRSPGEPLPRSLMRTLPAVAKDSHVSLPAILSMAYDPQPKHAEKPVTSCNREDARGLDLFDPTTNAHSAYSSTEKRPQPVNDMGMSIRHGQIWLAPTILLQPPLWDKYLLSPGTDFMPTWIPASTGPGLIGDIERRRSVVGIPRV